ncbi:tetratricopeptide repeat-containing diguanylate cyclase [Pengzhenrongella frigida]|uniref:tetratricopeptide repeat-containing diguanylate cyclase n=1 Tax=Pengzhenrongella frigida TaxID=1259133 RepID=UPI0013EC3FCF|nr:tetratricopeptide repeat-containing diguanylate cyclase [Cellulomonas sp. HLT2-17]
MPELPDWDLLIAELEQLLDSDARACADRATRALAQSPTDPDVEMRLSYVAALAHHLLAEDTAAMTAAARAEQIARARGEHVWRARALVCRAHVHYDLGDLEDAVDLLGEALALCREADDAAGTASVLNSLGAAYTDMVHFAPQAAQVLTEARRLWLATGEPDLASMALTNLAKMYVVTSGRLAEANPRGALAAGRHALDIARQAVAEADAVGLGRTCIDARLVVIGALMVGSDRDATSRALELTRSMLDRFPTVRQELAYRVVRGRWLVDTGQYDAAVLELCGGLDICDELTRPAERIELLKSLVEAHEGRRETSAALSTLHEVYDLTIQQERAVAERRAVLLSSRMDVERAQRTAQAAILRATALEQSISRLEHESSHDALTGLANRRSLDTALTSWATGHPRGFGCALIDIDHFKRVNDRWSHQAGDRVLTRLAVVLGDAVRASDFAARYGGEEFAVLLDGVDARTGAEACERIRAAVASREWDDLIPGGLITISIGLTLHREGDAVDALLARADAALYEAKHAGRNRVKLAP